MGRPKGSKNTGITLIIGECPDCGIKLGSYKSKKCLSHSKTGVPRPDMIGHTWNVGKGRPKGTPMLESAKRKQSEARKGVPLSAEHRAKIYAAVPRGAEHPNWKGGTGTERHMAMERIEYKQWRSAVFLKDNFTCQVCDQYNGSLHADHIKTWAEYPELRYAVDNGRTLCRACHYYITFKRKMNPTSLWGLTKQEK